LVSLQNILIFAVLLSVIGSRVGKRFVIGFYSSHAITHILSCGHSLALLNYLLMRLYLLS